MSLKLFFALHEIVVKLTKVHEEFTEVKTIWLHQAPHVPIIFNRHIKLKHNEQIES